MSEQVITYKKVTHSPGAIPLDAPAGGWDGEFLQGKTKVKPSSKGDPMVTFQLKITGADEEANEGCVDGRVLFVRVMLYADGDTSVHRYAKTQSAKLERGLAAACKFDLNIIPKDLPNNQEELEAALRPFIEAVEGNSVHFWTTLRDDNRNPGQKQTDVHFSKPGAAFGGQGLSSRHDDDDDDDDDYRTSLKTGPSNGSVNGSGGAKKASKARK